MTLIKLKMLRWAEDAIPLNVFSKYVEDPLCDGAMSGMSGAGEEQQMTGMIAGEFRRPRLTNVSFNTQVQLVPELVDKRVYDSGQNDPNYVFAGSLYIPKDIMALITSGEKFNLSPDPPLREPVSKGENEDVNQPQITVEDPELKKYIERIVRYSKFDPKEALATVRGASYEIKNRARTSLRRVSSSSPTEVQAYNSIMKKKVEDNDSSDGFLVPHKGLSIQAEENDDVSIKNKLTPRKKLFQKVISTLKGSRKSSTRLRTSTMKNTELEEIPGTSGYPLEEKNAYNEIFEDDKQAGKRKETQVLYNSDFNLTFEEKSLLSYLTKPRFAMQCELIAMPLSTGSSRKKSKNSTSRDTSSSGFDIKKVGKKSKPGSKASLNNKNVKSDSSMSLKNRSESSNIHHSKHSINSLLLPTTSKLSLRSTRKSSKVAVQGKKKNNSLILSSEAFIKVMDSLPERTCTVEIKGSRYRGKFNIGLDPVIDQAVFKSLKNLKEACEGEGRPYCKVRNQNSFLVEIAQCLKDTLLGKCLQRSFSKNEITNVFPVISKKTKSVKSQATVEQKNDETETLYSPPQPPPKASVRMSLSFKKNKSVRYSSPYSLRFSSPFSLRQSSPSQRHSSQSSLRHSSPSSLKHSNSSLKHSNLSLRHSNPSLRHSNGSTYTKKSTKLDPFTSLSGKQRNETKIQRYSKSFLRKFKKSKDKTSVNRMDGFKVHRDIRHVQINYCPEIGAKIKKGHWKVKRIGSKLHCAVSSSDVILSTYHRYKKGHKVSKSNSSNFSTSELPVDSIITSTSETSFVTNAKFIDNLNISELNNIILDKNSSETSHPNLTFSNQSNQTRAKDNEKLCINSSINDFLCNEKEYKKCTSLNAYSKARSLQDPSCFLKYSHLYKHCGRPDCFDMKAINEFHTLSSEGSMDNDIQNESNANKTALNSRLMKAAWKIKSSSLHPRIIPNNCLEKYSHEISVEGFLYRNPSLFKKAMEQTNYQQTVHKKELERDKCPNNSSSYCRIKRQQKMNNKIQHLKKMKNHCNTISATKAINNKGAIPKLQIVPFVQMKKDFLKAKCVSKRSLQQATSVENNYHTTWENSSDAPNFSLPGEQNIWRKTQEDGNTQTETKCFNESATQTYYLKNQPMKKKYNSCLYQRNELSKFNERDAIPMEISSSHLGNAHEIMEKVLKISLAEDSSHLISKDIHNQNSSIIPEINYKQENKDSSKPKNICTQFNIGNQNNTQITESCLLSLYPSYVSKIDIIDKETSVSVATEIDSNEQLKNIYQINSEKNNFYCFLTENRKSKHDINEVSEMSHVNMPKHINQENNIPLLEEIRSKCKEQMKKYTDSSTSHPLSGKKNYTFKNNFKRNNLSRQKYNIRSFHKSKRKRSNRAFKYSMNSYLLQDNSLFGNSESGKRLPDFQNSFKLPELEETIPTENDRKKARSESSLSVDLIRNDGSTNWKTDNTYSNENKTFFCYYNYQNQTPNENNFVIPPNKEKLQLNFTDVEGEMILKPDCFTSNGPSNSTNQDSEDKILHFSDQEWSRMPYLKNPIHKKYPDKCLMLNSPKVKENENKSQVPFFPSFKSENSFDPITCIKENYGLNHNENIGYYNVQGKCSNRNISKYFENQQLMPCQEPFQKFHGDTKGENLGMFCRKPENICSVEQKIQKHNKTSVKLNLQAFPKNDEFCNHSYDDNYLASKQSRVSIKPLFLPASETSKCEHCSNLYDIRVGSNIIDSFSSNCIRDKTEFQSEGRSNHPFHQLTDVNGIQSSHNDLSSFNKWNRLIKEPQTSDIGIQCFPVNSFAHHENIKVISNSSHGAINLQENATLLKCNPPCNVNKMRDTEYLGLNSTVNVKARYDHCQLNHSNINAFENYDKEKCVLPEKVYFTQPEFQNKQLNESGFQFLELSNKCRCSQEHDFPKTNDFSFGNNIMSQNASLSMRRILNPCQSNTHSTPIQVTEKSNFICTSSQLDSEIYKNPHMHLTPQREENGTPEFYHLQRCNDHLFARQIKSTNESMQTDATTLNSFNKIKNKLRYHLPIGKKSIEDSVAMKYNVPQHYHRHSNTNEGKQPFVTGHSKSAQCVTESSSKCFTAENVSTQSSNAEGMNNPQKQKKEITQFHNEAKHKENMASFSDICTPTFKKHFDSNKVPQVYRAIPSEVYTYKHYSDLEDANKWNYGRHISNINTVTNENNFEISNHHQQYAKQYLDSCYITDRKGFEISNKHKQEYNNHYKSGQDRCSKSNKENLSVTSFNNKGNIPLISLLNDSKGPPRSVKRTSKNKSRQQNKMQGEKINIKINKYKKQTPINIAKSESRVLKNYKMKNVPDNNNKYTIKEENWKSYHKYSKKHFKTYNQSSHEDDKTHLASHCKQNNKIEASSKYIPAFSNDFYYLEEQKQNSLPSFFVKDPSKTGQIKDKKSYHKTDNNDDFHCYQFGIIPTWEDLCFSEFLPKPIENKEKFSKFNFPFKEFLFETSYPIKNETINVLIITFPSKGNNDIASQTAQETRKKNVSMTEKLSAHKNMLRKCWFCRKLNKTKEETELSSGLRRHSNKSNRKSKECNSKKVTFRERDYEQEKYQHAKKENLKSKTSGRNQTLKQPHIKKTSNITMAHSNIRNSNIEHNENINSFEYYCPNNSSNFNQCNRSNTLRKQNEFENKSLMAGVQPHRVHDRTFTELNNHHKIIEGCPKHHMNNRITFCEQNDFHLPISITSPIGYINNVNQSCLYNENGYPITHSLDKINNSQFPLRKEIASEILPESLYCKSCGLAIHDIFLPVHPCYNCETDGRNDNVVFQIPNQPVIAFSQNNEHDNSHAKKASFPVHSSYSRNTMPSGVNLSRVPVSSKNSQQCNSSISYDSNISAQGELKNHLLKESISFRPVTGEYLSNNNALGQKITVAFSTQTEDGIIDPNRVSENDNNRVTMSNDSFLPNQSIMKSSDKQDENGQDSSHGSTRTTQDQSINKDNESNHSYSRKSFPRLPSAYEEKKDLQMKMLSTCICGQNGRLLSHRETREPITHDSIVHERSEHPRKSNISSKSVHFESQTELESVNKQNSIDSPRERETSNRKSSNLNKSEQTSSMELLEMEFTGANKRDFSQMVNEDEQALTADMNQSFKNSQQDNSSLIEKSMNEQDSILHSTERETSKNEPASPYKTDSLNAQKRRLTDKSINDFSQMVNEDESFIILEDPDEEQELSHQNQIPLKSSFQHHSTENDQRHYSQIENEDEQAPSGDFNQSFKNSKEDNSLLMKGNHSIVKSMNTEESVLNSRERESSISPYKTDSLDTLARRSTEKSKRDFSQMVNEDESSMGLEDIVEEEEVLHQNERSLKQSHELNSTENNKQHFSQMANAEHSQEGLNHIHPPPNSQKATIPIIFIKDGLNIKQSCICCSSINNKDYKNVLRIICSNPSCISNQHISTTVIKCNCQNTSSHIQRNSLEEEISDYQNKNFESEIHPKYSMDLNNQQISEQGKPSALYEEKLTLGNSNEELDRNSSWAQTDSQSMHHKETSTSLTEECKDGVCSSFSDPSKSKYDYLQTEPISNESVTRFSKESYEINDDLNFQAHPDINKDLDKSPLSEPNHIGRLKSNHNSSGNQTDMYSFAHKETSTIKIICDNPYCTAHLNDPSILKCHCGNRRTSTHSFNGNEQESSKNNFNNENKKPVNGSSRKSVMSYQKEDEDNLQKEGRKQSYISLNNDQQFSRLSSISHSSNERFVSGNQPTLNFMAHPVVQMPVLETNYMDSNQRQTHMVNLLKVNNNHCYQPTEEEIRFIMGENISINGSNYLTHISCENEVPPKTDEFSDTFRREKNSFQQPIELIDSLSGLISYERVVEKGKGLPNTLNRTCFNKKNGLITDSMNVEMQTILNDDSEMFLSKSSNKEVTSKQIQGSQSTPIEMRKNEFILERYKNQRMQPEGQPTTNITYYSRYFHKPDITNSFHENINFVKSCRLDEKNKMPLEYTTKDTQEKSCSHVSLYSTDRNEIRQFSEKDLERQTEENRFLARSSSNNSSIFHNTEIPDTFYSLNKTSKEKMQEKMRIENESYFGELYLAEKSLTTIKSKESLPEKILLNSSSEFDSSSENICFPSRQTHLKNKQLSSAKYVNDKSLFSRTKRINNFSELTSNLNEEHSSKMYKTPENCSNSKNAHRLNQFLNSSKCNSSSEETFTSRFPVNNLDPEHTSPKKRKKKLINKLKRRHILKLSSRIHKNI